MAAKDTHPTGLTDRAPRIGSGDRFGMTLFLSIVVHALVILGIGFATNIPDRELPPLIEITLAQNPTDERPEDYDFLAPDDQDGGGTLDEAQRPSEQAALIPDPRDMDDLVQEEATPPSPSEPDTVRTILAEESQTRLPDPEDLPEEIEAEVTELSMVDLNLTRQQVARDIADPTQTIDWDARYPSKQRINARTRSHAAAAYMRGWIEKVERVGNLNYPDEARRRGLTGRLILEVTLYPDGTVEDVRVLERSDYALLDESAMRVVAMAAPYAPVPEEVLEGKDRLVITRTWEFVRTGGMEMR
ncbi:protein TonB [Natronocella acetinitrilica]|jgi:periplasmic protein TonB|uniref:Protein TonB n=1 Tax=Natronocella acetinitrilica TaxID=414046 RepID=A0AAE3G4Y0_9GAMM|nr:energy transducer TonB [Natronocella acetinitrilica]MCP1675134.1 protein TonB [Natronocella acetinitrilica]